LLSLSNVVILFGQDTRAAAEVHATQTGALVQLWTSEKIVSRGDRMHVWFSTTQNAFVAVLRIDTDGRVRILQPERPWHDSYVQAGRLHEVQNPACDDADCAFVIDDYPGKGYVFAVASVQPFELDAYVNGDYWDYRAIAHRGRVTGDPYVALSTLMGRVVSQSRGNRFSYDVYPYDVGSQFEYPRFLCYECHSHVQYPAWDPYENICTRFQIVRYDEPAYDPASTFGDTRTVYARAGDLKARYVIEDRNPEEPFVSIGRTRPDTSSARGSTGVGATAADVGGVGSVPAPLGHNRLWSSPSGRAARSDTSAPRPRPQLRRRVAAKPDSIPLIRPRTPQNTAPRVQTRLRRTKPDTSGFSVS